MKKCPFCAKEIQDEAIVCRHCRRDIHPPVESVFEVAQDVGTPPKPSGKSDKTVEMQGARETDAERIGASRDGEGKAELKEKGSSRRADLSMDKERRRDARKNGIVGFAVGVLGGLVLVWLGLIAEVPRDVSLPLMGPVIQAVKALLVLVGAVSIFWGIVFLIQGLLGHDPFQKQD